MLNISTTTVVLLGLATLFLAAVACGPSETEIQARIDQAVDQAIAESEQRTANLIAQAVAESERRTTTFIDQEGDYVVDRVNTRLHSQFESQVARLQESMDAMTDRAYERLQVLVDEEAEANVAAETELAEELTQWAEVTTRLQTNQQGLEADYWVNTNRTMLWGTFDNLQGGDTTIEDVTTFWDGIALDDEYEQVSTLCSFDQGGYLTLSGMLEE
ncbi:MAG: hypothetical protein OXC95_02605 [Dehalococcoidia bacterium]|nr:hypothetical protein [Dehalococcoidia bacterium]